MKKILINMDGRTYTGDLTSYEIELESKSEFFTPALGTMRRIDGRTYYLAGSWSGRLTWLGVSA